MDQPVYAERAVVIDKEALIGRDVRIVRDRAGGGGRIGEDLELHDDIGRAGQVRVTADWVIGGGALVMPAGKRSVTINASVTDNAGRTGTSKAIVTVSGARSGQDLTPQPPGR